MPIANPKTNNTIPVTYGLKAARYEIVLPPSYDPLSDTNNISDLYPRPAASFIIVPNVLKAANGRELDLLMNDTRVTRFQPQQVRIRIVYE